MTCERRDLILILDFGRSTRSSSRGACASRRSTREIHPFNLPLAQIRELAPRGIILSGGPASCYDAGRAAGRHRALRPGRADPRHLLRRAADGPAARRQGGRRPTGASTAARTVQGHASRGRRCSTASAPARRSPVWMSHGDRVESLPAGLHADRRERQLPGGRGGGARAQVLGRAVPPRGGAHPARRRDPGATSCSASAAAEPSWTMASFVDEAVGGGAQPGRRRRGASSAACRAASTRRWRRRWCCSAIGDRLTCIFVDNGPAAGGRGRAGRGAVPRRLQGRPARGRRQRALPGQARRASPTPSRSARSSAREFIAVFEEEAQARRRRRRRLPGAGHAVPRRDRVGVARRARRRPSSRTTTWAACPSA